jgi:hypothetical protein
MSLSAIVLSQIPPVHLLLRPRRLDVEVHSRILLTHLVGNANLTLVVSVRNTGGRDLRVRGLRIDLMRDGKVLGSFPAQNYYETPSSTSLVLLVPFSLKRGEQWAQGVHFLNFFDRKTEKLFKESQSAISRDIRRRIDTRSEGDKNLVVAEPALVAPFEELFSRMFLWEAGEYVATLSVKAEPGSASYTKAYRFTLYESDMVELKRYAEEYKYGGGGITYNTPENAGIGVQLTEHRS